MKTKTKQTDFKEHVKSSIDIVDYIGKDVSLHKKNHDDYRGTVGTRGKTGESLIVTPSTQLWNDTKHGTGGDIFTWIAYHEGLDNHGDFPEILRIAADFAGLEMEGLTDEDRAFIEEGKDVTATLNEVTEIYHQNLLRNPEAIQQVKDDWNFGLDEIKAFKMGYATGEDLKHIENSRLVKAGLGYKNSKTELFVNRIMYPYLIRDNTVYFIGKKTPLTPKEKKGKEPGKYKKLLTHDGNPDVSRHVNNKFLFGEDTIRKSDYVLIAEGISDAVSAIQRGYPTISAVTTHIKGSEIDRVSKIIGERPVQICLDIDNGGMKGAREMAEKLTLRSNEVSIITLTDSEGKKDFDLNDYITNGSSLPPLEDRLNAYPEHIKKKANDILDHGDPFLYICDTWNESHVGDRNLGEMLACSITSTQVLNLSVGIHEKPSGDTESGKSSACVKMGNLTPYWKFRSTTFSPKVLYYMKDLLPGTIIYTDDIDFAAPGVVSTIKKVTGEFEDPTISDTIIDGEAVNMFIPPRINFWLSSVDTVSDKQLGTRFVYSNTEGGTEHDREVNYKQKGKALGKPLEEDDEKILICRCMFEYICDQLHYVFSPHLFASTWSSESEKRNYEKFMSVLFALTVFNYRQRETLHGNLLGTLDDWERAISVYAPVAKNNSCLLSDEEILILFSLHEMLETGAFEDGVPHKRLLAYMKDEGRFAKSDATLRRMLIGEIGSGDGKKGFKEKVPGFSHEMVSVPKLDENGLKVTRYTKTLCYSYNDTLFDEIIIPAGSDIVKAIKTDTFVVGDNYTAQAVEQLFREDPVKAHSLKKDRATFETWKESLRNHQISSDFTRFHQIAKPMKSEKPSQPLPINNDIVYNNNIRLQESSNNGVGGISVCAVVGEIDEDTRAKLIDPYSEKNANSMKSESLNSDCTLQSGCNLVKSGTVVLKSESADNGNTLNSEEPQAVDNKVYLIPLLRQALVKLAKTEYHSTVLDIDEFTRNFNSRTPEYKKGLGSFVVENEARKLKKLGW